VQLDAGALLALKGTDVDGESIHLGALAETGKPTAVIFWQTWCAPCLRETPRLAKAAKEWGDRITFVGVVPGPDSSVREDEVRRLAEEHALPYPQVRDRELAWSKAFQVQGTPTIFVLDREGHVLFSGHRSPGDWGAFLTP
jgi:thiol-disulfide isomerase/thioredoxin